MKLEDFIKAELNTQLLTPSQWEGIKRAMENYKQAQVEQLLLTGASKSFTYKDISKVAEDLANEYSSDKKDPVWRDIKQDGIKAIQAFVSKHL